MGLTISVAAADRGHSSADLALPSNRLTKHWAESASKWADRFR